VKLSCGEDSVDVRVEDGQALVGDRRVAFDAVENGGRLGAIRIGQRVFRIRTARVGERVLVWCEGEAFEFRRAAARPTRPRETSGGLAAPMPGRVRMVVAVPGTRVSRGEVVLILEAMKMEHAIRAPRDGTVARILSREGDLVEAGAVLAEIS
jgi:3-methylcrotonyl-CoA carboxylase alpha subunit